MSISISQIYFYILVIFQFLVPHIFSNTSKPLYELKWSFDSWEMSEWLALLLAVPTRWYAISFLETTMYFILIFLESCTVAVKWSICLEHNKWSLFEMKSSMKNLQFFIRHRGSCLSCCSKLYFQFAVAGVNDCSVVPEGQSGLLT